MNFRKSLMVVGIAVVSGVMLAACGEATRTSDAPSPEVAVSPNVSLSPLTTKDGELVTSENFNPEEFGYTRSSDIQAAEKEAGFLTLRADESSPGGIKATYVGKSRVGTKELVCYHDGFGVSQWPSDPVDYAALVETIKKENASREKALASDPDMKELQGNAPLPTEAQLPAVMLIEGKTVGVCSDLEGNIYLFEWWDAGYTYQLGSFAGELNNDQKLSILKSF